MKIYTAMWTTTKIHLVTYDTSRSFKDQVHSRCRGKSHRIFEVITSVSSACVYCVWAIPYLMGGCTCQPLNTPASLHYCTLAHDIKQKCTHPLNTLLTLTGTDFCATQWNTHTRIQTILPFGFGIHQHCWGTKHYNNSPHHPSNHIEQRSTNHHWLYTNYSNKPSPYEIQVLALLYHINMPLTQFLVAASANLVTHATTYWHTNQLHVASRLHKHCTQDSSALFPNILLIQTSTLTSQT